MAAHPFPQILTRTHPSQLTARRLDILTEHVVFNRDRMLAWGYCQAVLAGIWSCEENLDEWRDRLACAEYVRPE